MTEQSKDKQIEELQHLVRFLAGAWDGANTWIFENAAHLDAIGQYPIVQGTGNQMRLVRIGEQECDASKIPAAVDAMLETQHNIGES